jgi:hypothetical protein
METSTPAASFTRLLRSKSCSLFTVGEYLQSLVGRDRAREGARLSGALPLSRILGDELDQSVDAGPVEYLHPLFERRRLARPECPRRASSGRGCGARARGRPPALAWALAEHPVVGERQLVQESVGA